MVSLASLSITDKTLESNVSQITLYQSYFLCLMYISNDLSLNLSFFRRPLLNLSLNYLFPCVDF